MGADINPPYPPYQGGNEGLIMVDGGETYQRGWKGNLSGGGNGTYQMVMEKNPLSGQNEGTSLIKVE